MTVYLKYYRNNHQYNGVLYSHAIVFFLCLHYLSCVEVLIQIMTWKLKHDLSILLLVRCTHHYITTPDLYLLYRQAFASLYLFIF